MDAWVAQAFWRRHQPTTPAPNSSEGPSLSSTPPPPAFGRLTWQSPGGPAEQIGYVEAVHLGPTVHVAGQLGVGPRGPDPAVQAPRRVHRARRCAARRRGTRPPPRRMTSYHTELGHVPAAAQAKTEVLGELLVAWTVLKAPPPLFNPAFLIRRCLRYRLSQRNPCTPGVRSVRVLFIFLALVFGGGALAAHAGADAVRDGWTELGVSDGLGTVIALLELAAVAGLLIGLWRTPFGAAAAAGITLLMVGAVIYHVRADDYAGAVPAVVLGLLAGTAAVLSWQAAAARGVADGSAQPARS